MLPPSIQLNAINDENAAKHLDAAIIWLASNYDQKPTLVDAANAANMDLTRFKKTFRRLIGVCPERFLDHVRKSYVRADLETGKAVPETALESEPLASSMSHGLSIVCELTTSIKNKPRGSGITVHYGTHNSPFGQVLLAETDRGICWFGFVSPDDNTNIIAEFREDWPAATMIEQPSRTKQIVTAVFNRFTSGTNDAELPSLLLVGTYFQIKVWKALLTIPRGVTLTYKDIAQKIGNPNASRAVGRAIGANPISLLVPCHRIILRSGIVHNYRWGIARKRALIALERAYCETRRREP